MNRYRSQRRQRKAHSEQTARDMHQMVVDHANVLTDGLASETRDMDSYLLALIQLVICRTIPCRFSVIADLRRTAAAEGYE